MVFEIMLQTSLKWYLVNFQFQSIPSQVEFFGNGKIFTGSQRIQKQI